MGAVATSNIEENRKIEGFQASRDEGHFEEEDIDNFFEDLEDGEVGEDISNLEDGEVGEDATDLEDGEVVDDTVNLEDGEVVEDADGPNLEEGEVADEIEDLEDGEVRDSSTTISAAVSQEISNGTGDTSANTPGVDPRHLSWVGMQQPFGNDVDDSILTTPKCTVVMLKAQEFDSRSGMNPIVIGNAAVAGLCLLLCWLYYVGYCKA